MDQKFEGILQLKKIRPTAMRLLVLEQLSAQKSAISLSDLEHFFEKSDRVTLYRTLKTFRQKGLVHTIDDGSGAPKYALCEEGCSCVLDKDLHVHFHCKVCTETFCLTDFRIPEISLPVAFKADEASLVVKGVCSSCSG
ncbi:Fur family transcriptional regulator [Anditalea andensis]|uniref:Transcriptional regulator n=1 Tax=Anditalea andensis TaxID=1048983 RepID=A0A074L5J5_9BACT|nr:transcriptional repressor [Anditalea andensis]KEO75750.1 transcriptional regulator [Anditalea andensis]